ncbi:Fic family protein [Mycoplasmopsis iners]|uniref:Fic family protein n=1 Tax=Mycoplasmopsis iners TaxID=76630 RepID=UPI000497DA87|nr:Fic family protein [Mycoplasmopsis iners]
MKRFNYSNIKNKKWSSEIISLIAAVYKEVGKQELYFKKHAYEFEKLVELAKIQSTESSNAIEGILTTNIRIKQLVKEKIAPRNRDEQEIAGYRDVLTLIHENFDVISITKNNILHLHKILYSHQNNLMAGKTKSVQNYITAFLPNSKEQTIFTPLAPYETAEALERLCVEYNKAISNNQLDPLLLIPNFIHDFLCIHPFNDGNGRISRLLTTLLLYQNGFYVGKYISLESKISKNKDLYYEALKDAQNGWHENTHDNEAFIKYFLKIVLAAYKDLDERFNLIEIKVPVIEMVQKAINTKLGRFTKQNIVELCPSISISSIEGALRKLVASGILIKEGVGKNICYYKNEKIW